MKGGWAPSRAEDSPVQVRAGSATKLSSDLEGLNEHIMGQIWEKSRSSSPGQGQLLGCEEEGGSGRWRWWGVDRKGGGNIFLMGKQWKEGRQMLPHPQAPREAWGHLQAHGLSHILLRKPTVQQQASPPLLSLLFPQQCPSHMVGIQQTPACLNELLCMRT